MADGKAHILVVDDDPDFVCAHQLALERAGYLVDTASSASSAIEQLQAGGIDLVVLDVMLEHDTAGFEVCYAIRQHPQIHDVAVLMVSSVEREGHDIFDPGETRGCMTCDDFARKPVAPAELVQRVQALLQKKGKA